MQPPRLSMMKVERTSFELVRSCEADPVLYQEAGFPCELETAVDPAGAVDAGGEEIKRVVHWGRRQCEPLNYCLLPP